ncbi:nucleoside recognition domain-containing protein [Telmatospirillum sp. J64-1]|uniref:nucleoside recognition domain-containing protein n=1 Tax=Telmatospirillum sp. J64-1 TaxID=2502183 RepID=UPI00115E2E4A|nr:nucleoside recognition domain-containing protein [Telmatospirillum sp. J64-1]
MNIIFFVLVAVAFVVAAWRHVQFTGEGATPMEQLAQGVIQSADSSVTLALGLIGVMTLFLGLMKVAEAGGLLVIVARTVRPLMQRLFPDVPPDHPAMGAMIMNMSANVLGLGNAATPFGIRAMQELDSLNRQKGTASNAMILFLAINTSSVTLLPTGVIALRAAAGSTDPAGIVPTTLFATIVSTTVAICMAKLLQRRSPMPVVEAQAEEEAQAPDQAKPASDQPVADESVNAYPLWVSVLVLGGIAALVPLTVMWGRQIAPWIIPGLVVALLGFGMMRGVRIYEAFVEGAKDGFQVAVRIIPYLVAILTAVGMFRASGAMDMVIVPLGRVTELIGLPAEALPMALLRPLSGSGAYGILAAVINDPAIGPDSYAGYLVSTLQGSTETTFYVLAVYFGAINVRRLRHAIPTALSADIAGVAAAVFICALLYGGLA